MEIVEFSSSAMSNVCQIHPIECDPKQNELAEHYIQYGATTIADFPDDPRFGCMGNFQIATNGMPTTGEAVGELWVTYDVELRKPQLSSTTVSTAEYHLGGALDATSTTFVATKETWSGFPTVPGGAVPFTYHFTGSTPTSTAIHIVCKEGATGSYMFSLNGAGSGFDVASPPITPGPGVLATNIFATNAEESAAYVGYASSSGSQCLVAALTFTAADQEVALGMATGEAGTISYWDLVITKYNPGLATARPRALTSLDKKLAERDERLERLEKLLLGKQKQEEWEAGAAAAALPVVPRVTPASIWKISPTDTRLVQSLQRRAVTEAPFVGPVPRAPPGLSTESSTSGSNKK